MSKGTTTTTGLTHSYFANIFGPPQYRDLHEEIAQKYFDHFFQKDIFVGEMRTQLGISGKEYSGPEEFSACIVGYVAQKRINYQSMNNYLFIDFSRIYLIIR